MKMLVVNDSASEQQLALAAEMLETRAGVVELEGIVRLRPGRDEIECAVPDSSRAVARCEEEYKVMVENAARALHASRLGKRLPRRALRWVVVDSLDKGSAELWREPQGCHA